MMKMCLYATCHIVLVVFERLPAGLPHRLESSEVDDAGDSVLGVAVLAEHLLYGGPVPQVAVVEWHGLSCQLLNRGHHPCTRAQFRARPGVPAMMAPAAALLRLSSTATLWPASSSLTAQWEPT